MAKVKRHRTESPHLRLNSRTAECLAYGLLILLLGVWQLSPRGWPAVCGGRPLLLVPLVVAVAMFSGPVGGAAAGVAAGVLWGLFSEALFGFHALMLMLLGCAVGLLVRLLLRNNALSALLLCGGGTAVYALADWLCNCVLPHPDGALLLLWRTVLPNTVYTLVLCLPLYGVVRGITKLLKNRERVN
ncbi:MAG: hypothetical protein E7552_04810 [Ruminococcaceae bacterium]|nr:hypothetical protein [Oscillospiraceae bacterium]